MGSISHVSDSLLFSAQFVVVEKHTYVTPPHAVLSVELSAAYVSAWKRCHEVPSQVARLR